MSDGTVASSDGTVGNAVALSASNDAAGALGLFDAFTGRALHVTDLQANVHMTRAQRQAYLRRFTLPKRVRAGQTVTASVVAKVVRGATKTFRFRFHVPRRARAGHRTFTLKGASPDGVEDLFGAITIDLGDLSSEPDTEGPRTAADLARAFRAFGRYDGLRLKGRGTRVYRDATYRIGGHAAARTTVVRP